MSVDINKNPAIPTKENQERITEWIRNKCGQMRCFCCGLQEFEFTFSTLSIGFDIDTTRIYYAMGLPQIPIVCKNCGYILYFSPGIMGIKPKTPDEHQVEIPLTK